MIELLKKGLITFAVLFFLIGMLYVAFYLFLIALAVITFTVMYMKWKGIMLKHPLFRQKTHSTNQQTSHTSSPHQHSDQKVIDVEYEEIIVHKDDR